MQPAPHTLELVSLAGKQGAVVPHNTFLTADADRFPKPGEDIRARTALTSRIISREKQIELRPNLINRRIVTRNPTSGPQPPFLPHTREV